MSAAREISDLLSVMDGMDRADRYTEMLRVAKVVEEAGEAMQALIAYHGVNPRKDAGTLEELIIELCDVALSATIAVESFGYDAALSLRAREIEVLARLRAKAAMIDA